MSKKPNVGIVFFDTGNKEGLGITGAVIVLVLAVFIIGILAIPVAIIGGLYLAYRCYRLYQNRPSKLEADAREETEKLYQVAVTMRDVNMSKEEFATEVGMHLVDAIPEVAQHYAIVLALDLYDAEGFGSPIPPPPLVCNSIEGARYRDMLTTLDANSRDAEMRRCAKVISDSCNAFLGRLPHIEEGDSSITLPLYTFHKDLPRALTGMMVWYLSDRSLPFFAHLRATLKENYDKAKCFPDAYKGTDIVNTYLQHTPLLDLVNAPVPLAIRPEVKYEHTIIVGGSGQGKTVLLENLIKTDLTDPRRPAIVVVDSQQHLIAKLSRMAEVHARRLIIVDPKDAPAMNVFAMNAERLAGYGEVEREQMLNRALETFSYLFDALLGSDLTAKQGAVFNYIVTLMLTFPNAMGRSATLFDMVKLTEDPGQYKDAINQLDPIPRDFFLKEFSGAQYKQTREQIRYRLHAILGNPTLSRLFLAPTNTLDWFEEINNGSIILVDTDKNHLGEKNSSYMGRVALTLVLQAVLERGSHRGTYAPLHLYVDEAGEYFDKSIDSFLTEARKYQCGITLAVQHLGKMPSLDLRNSVAANTSTKYAGGLSTADARILAPDMHTTPQFLTAQQRLTFACFIRNATPEALTVPVQVGVLDNAPKIQESTYQAYREANRDRLRAPAQAEEALVPPSEGKPKRAPKKVDTIEESFEC